MQVAEKQDKLYNRGSTTQAEDSIYLNTLRGSNLTL